MSRTMGNDSEHNKALAERDAGREHLQKIVKAYESLTDLIPIAVDTFGLIDDRARWQELIAAIEAAREEVAGG